MKNISIAKTADLLYSEFGTMILAEADSIAISSFLYNKGYRETSEVAREIFEEVTNAWVNSRTESEFLDMLKELKKKYTEDKE